MTSRRTHLTALGLGLVAGPLVPERAAAEQQIELVAKRKQITLPKVPTVGVPYIATFDLTDPSGKPAGTAAATTFIVDVTPQGPVIFSDVVLQLSNGELHYRRLMNRFGDYPRNAVGAVLGGTGAYASARGEVKITWPDADTIKIVAVLST